MLKPGEIIRYDAALWRVEYVNASRARIVPLLKRHVVLKDDDGNEKRAFDSEQRGVSISPNSLVEIVSDLEAAKNALEMSALEKEIAELKAQAEREAKGVPEGRKAGKTDRSKVDPRKGAAPAVIISAVSSPAPEGSSMAEKGTRGAGWFVVGEATTIPGSLKELVLVWLATHPGETTKQVAAAIPAHTPGAVAACLDRFRKAGVLLASAAAPSLEVSKATTPVTPRSKVTKAAAPETTDF